MALNQQEKTQIEQNSVLQNNIENLEREQTLDVVHNYQRNLNNFQIETESHILAQNVQAQEESMLTRWINNQETSMLTQWLNRQKTPQILSEEESEKIIDNQTLREVASTRIVKCQELLNWLKWNRRWKKDLERQVQRAIDTDLTPMANDNYNYSNLNEYKKRLRKIIFDYYNNREPARQIIMMWWRAPVINWSADTKAEARSDRRSAKNNANFQIDLSELEQNTAIYRIIWANADEWKDYFNFIWQWWIATGHPMFIQYSAGFNQIREYNPDVYRAMTPKWQITYDAYCQRNPQQTNPQHCSNWNIWFNQNRRYRTWTIWDDIASMIEDHQRKNWKEVNPQQREARRKIWNIWSIVWCIALGVGIFKEIFNPWKDKDWNKKRDWWKILWFWASIYWITHYKDVKNIFFDAFNLDPDNYVARRQDERAREEAQNNTWLSQSETNELINAKIAYPTLVATTIWTIPIKQLVEQKIVEEKDWKLVLNKTNYATYVENIALALWRSDKDKQEMLDKIASDEAARSISYGLSYCWINTLNDLNNLKESETSTLMDSATFKTKFKAQIDAITKQNWIFSNMAKQWFIPTGLEETINILENYDSSKNENEQILQRLKAWLLKTDPERKYSISDMLNDPDINLENMTMRWFTNSWWTEIRFDSYWDLFDTVRLTKRIKNNFRWRPAKSDAPFHIDELKWRIEFDDTERYELRKNETDVIRNRTLRKTSSLLTKNKQFYVDYLNKWRKEDQNRITEENKIDLSWYPILKGTWINFTDANEARKSEQLLSKIKYELRHRKKTNAWDAFEITTTNYWISIKTKIKFTSIWWTEFKYNISDYPTLIKNKEKLLQYLNNPINKMRWSEPIVHH